MRNVTIFAPSHGTRSCAKILFAYAEKDGRAKIAANENIRNIDLLFPAYIVQTTIAKKSTDAVKRSG
jgi:hypothetical protein